MLFFVLLLVLFAFAGGQYDYNFDTWPAQCRNGRKQSPVEIKNTINVNFPRIKFTGYKRSICVHIENANTTVKFKIESSEEAPYIEGGGLHYQYTLDHVHLHWPSEHVINGKRYAMEGHLVHYATKYGNLSNAVSKDKGVTVLAVMVEVDNSASSRLGDILSLVPLKSENSNKKQCQISIDDFMPNNKKVFFRYDGSLTTPACSEGVVWTVFKNTLSITKSQLNCFKNDVAKIEDNARPLQPLNGRHIYLRESIFA